MAHWKSIVRLVIVFGVVGILGRLTFAYSGPATGLVRGVCIGILGIIALWYVSKWEEELKDISSFEPFTVAIQPTNTNNTVGELSPEELSVPGLIGRTGDT